MMPLAHPLSGQPKYVKVIKTEEKGSDVNIAAHMVNDGHKGLYQVAVLISNDSDLVEPVKIIRNELKLPVGVLNPFIQSPSFDLRKCATFVKPIRRGVISASQFPSTLKDANGNMTQRVEGGLTYNQTFDAENRLISVTVSGQTTQFIYDGDGNLVKKINPNGSKTLYVGGIYEVDKGSGGSVTRTVTYYPVGGAMRINSTLYYLLKDHLGSASVVTDASGNILGEQRYYPFGETRLTTGTIYTDKLFTGQREMAGLGIYHYQARFYSAKLGGS
jgi:YD repeat-containing protein